MTALQVAWGLGMFVAGIVIGPQLVRLRHRFEAHQQHAAIERLVVEGAARTALQHRIKASQPLDCYHEELDDDLAGYVLVEVVVDGWRRAGIVSPDLVRVLQVDQPTLNRLRRSSR